MKEQKKEEKEEKEEIEEKEEKEKKEEHRLHRWVRCLVSFDFLVRRRTSIGPDINEHNSQALKLKHGTFALRLIVTVALLCRQRWRVSQDCAMAG